MSGQDPDVPGYEQEHPWLLKFPSVREKAVATALRRRSWKRSKPDATLSIRELQSELNGPVIATWAGLPEWDIRQVRAVLNRLILAGAVHVIEAPGKNSPDHPGTYRLNPHYRGAKR